MYLIDLLNSPIFDRGSLIEKWESPFHSLLICISFVSEDVTVERAGVYSDTPNKMALFLCADIRNWALGSLH
jgi:hypothetical protein